MNIMNDLVFKFSISLPFENRESGGKLTFAEKLALAKAVWHNDQKHYIKFQTYTQINHSSSIAENISMLSSKSFYEPFQRIMRGEESEMPVEIVLYLNYGSVEKINEPDFPVMKDYSYLIPELEEFFDTEFFKPSIFSRPAEVIDRDEISYETKTNNSILSFKTKIRFKIDPIPKYSQNLAKKRFSKPTFFSLAFDISNDVLQKVMDSIQNVDIFFRDYKYMALLKSCDSKVEELSSIKHWIERAGYFKPALIGVVYHYAKHDDPFPLKVYHGALNFNEELTSDRDKNREAFSRFYDKVDTVNAMKSCADEFFADYEEANENKEKPQTLKDFLVEFLTRKFDENPLMFVKKFETTDLGSFNAFQLIRDISNKRLVKLEEEDATETES